MSESADKQRNRSRTEEAILTAAKDTLANQGFAGWGVNGIARAARCDKQLIYRYFGGLDGLAEAIGEDIAAWMEEALSARPGAAPSATYAELVSRLLLEFMEALRGNPLAQKIIAWEVAEESPLVKRFAAARGRVMMAWIARERGDLAPPQGVDVFAANALLVAGIQHLVLAGAASGSFSGIDLTDEANWARVRAAVVAMAEAAYRA
jgi:AcrR family transcriptional regulator